MFEEEKSFEIKSGSFNSVEDLQRSLHMIHRPYHPPLNTSQKPAKGHYIPAVIKC